MSQQAFGIEGDFTTAPEISQIFGELIGLWLLEGWRSMDSPADFNLVEFGPGRGVLMEDILRATRLRMGFSKAACLWLLETSGRLRIEQQRRLKGAELKPLWADELADVPAAPNLIVANEFFDCLPIRQFQRIERGWRERLVGVNDNGRLDYTLGNTPPPESYGLPDDQASEPGDIFEIGFAARDFMAELASRLVSEGGAALVIDYGHVASGLGDTLQAVRGHRFWPPLSTPGRADLTAHVDFGALADIAIDAGAAVYGPTPQGRFLERLGLALRTEMLCKDKPEDEQRTIRMGADRIAAPDQMGEIFKVMCVASPEFPAPAGFFDI
jgi:SAM-dependent MidA family methyltransferase